MQPASDVIDGAFLKFLLMSQPMQQRLFAEATGATVTGIKASLLKRVPIFYPKNIFTQRKIVSDIEDLEKTVKRLRSIYLQNLPDLADLKQSILQKAFSGELTGREEAA